jgi:hypothetical protein
MDYRKIWERVNGPIPKDDKGRSFQIHHVDGNNQNNAIENLKCVSLEEHYQIHLQQGDIFAASMIYARLQLTEEDRQHINKKISDSCKGRIPPNKGKKLPPRSEEHRKNLSKANKGKKYSEEHCKNIAKALTGKSHSEERKRKQSEAHKKIKVETLDGSIVFDSCKLAAKYYNVFPSRITYWLKKGKFIRYCS